MNSSSDITLKIILGGAFGVGKTSLRRNFMGISRFRRNYIPTVGSDFSYKELNLNDKIIRLLIWDLAGEIKFRQFRSLYFQGAHGALLIFDLVDRDSFNNLKEWINDLENFTGSRGVPFIVIGNKKDLILLESEQAVSDKEIINFCDNLRSSSGEKLEISFFKTSALNGENVNLAFMELINKIIEWLPKRKIEHNI